MISSSNLSIRTQQATTTTNKIQLGNAPLEVHCSRRSGCNYVRGHEGVCSVDLEAELQRARNEVLTVNEEAGRAREAAEQRRQEVEILTDLLERYQARDEEKATEAIMAMVQVLMARWTENEPGELVMVAMDLIEAARDHLRQEFMTTLAANLVEERNNLRDQVSRLEDEVVAWRRMKKAAEESREKAGWYEAQGRPIGTNHPRGIITAVRPHS